MNFEDLKKIDLKSIDLKSIDLNTIIKLFSGKKELLIQVIAVVATVFVLIVMVTSYQSNAQSAQNEIQELSNKAEVVRKYDGIQSTFKSFMDNVSKDVDINDISSEVSDYAVKSGVNILSISPNGKKSDIYSDSFFLDIGTQCKTYKNLLEFIRNIESSVYPLRLEAVSVLSSDAGAMSDNSNESSDAPVQVIEAKLQIAYVVVKK